LIPNKSKLKVAFIKRYAGSILVKKIVLSTRDGKTVKSDDADRQKQKKVDHIGRVAKHTAYQRNLQAKTSYLFSYHNRIRD
jgi:hypothetical protein